MMMNTSSLPPATLTDEAMKLAAGLLQVAADPAGTKSRLDELTAQMAAVRSAIDEHAGLRSEAAEVAAAQDALVAREAALVEREQTVANARTALDVASSANAARAKALDERETAVSEAETMLAAREKGLEARIASYKAALSA